MWDSGLAVWTIDDRKLPATKMLADDPQGQSCRSGKRGFAAKLLRLTSPSRFPFRPTSNKSGIGWIIQKRDELQCVIIRVSKI